MKYYDTDVLITAGREIRRLAKDADKLAPTERVRKIATIFSYFKNPDKETVLTPWRVVNMHMSDTLGGWCFYNEHFEEDTQEEVKRLVHPRFVDRGKVTQDTLCNPKSTILEINSKSGLYPLYVAYSLYRAKLGLIPEEDITPQAQQKYWNDVIQNEVFVVCKTPMAKYITKRTLVGYTSTPVNTQYYKDLLDVLKTSPEKFQKKVSSAGWWQKEGGSLRFDAIVGNPPYQQMDNGSGRGMSAIPLYNYFVDCARSLEPNYVSMITPSRWFAGGKGLDDFRASMLSDKHIQMICDYANSADCFPQIDIAGGVNYFLWALHHTGPCEVTSVRGKERLTLTRSLDEFDIFVRNNASVDVIHHVLKSDDLKMDEVVYSRNVFGITSDEHGTETKISEDDLVLISSQKGNSLGASFIAADKVLKNNDLVWKYKVIIGKVVPRNGEVGVDPSIGYRAITTVHIMLPGQVFTETYLLLAAFDSLEEAENFAKYMTCKFPRFLLHETYSSMNITKSNFRFVPYLEMDHSWSDSELYERYACNEEEIQIIESMIRPLEYVIHFDSGEVKKTIFETEDIQDDSDSKSGVKVLVSDEWVRYYGDTESELNLDMVGKWICAYTKKDFAEHISRKAIVEGVVSACQHSNADEGIICFYVNGEDLEEHRRLISWMLSHDLLHRDENGVLDNIEFTYDMQTTTKETDFTLESFVDLVSGTLKEL